MRLQRQLSFQFPNSDGISLSYNDANKLDGYSVSASFNSVPIFLGQILGFCANISATGGAANATVKLQGCVDIPTKGQLNEQVPDAGLANWFDLALPDPRTNSVAVSQTISGASSAIFLEDSAMYRWVRLVWTNVSGSAVVTAHIEIKGVG